MEGQKFPGVACITGWSTINKVTTVTPDIWQDDRIPYELYAGTFVKAIVMAQIRLAQSVLIGLSPHFQVNDLSGYGFTTLRAWLVRQLK